MTSDDYVTVGDPLTAGNVTNKSLEFHPLQKSREGRYTCQTYVEAGDSYQLNATYNLEVQSKSTLTQNFCIIITANLAYFIVRQSP